MKLTQAIYRVRHEARPEASPAMQQLEHAWGQAGHVQRPAEEIRAARAHSDVVHAYIICIHTRVYMSRMCVCVCVRVYI